MQSMSPIGLRHYKNENMIKTRKSRQPNPQLCTQTWGVKLRGVKGLIFQGVIYALYHIQYKQRAPLTQPTTI